MGLIRDIPKRSIYIPTTTRFVATFNNPTAGAYDFGIAANVEVPVTPITRGMIYWIDRISFSATTPEGDYLSSIITQPELILTWQQDGTRVFSRPLPLVNYRDGQEVNTAIESTKGNEILLATVTGVLNQVPAWIGITDITMQISLDLYQIYDLNWIRHWRDNTEPKLGAELRR